METILLAACLLLSAAGAVWDVRSRRIPNLLCLALAVASLARLIVAEGFGAAGSSAIHAALALIVGMILFRVRMLGAGDAKFYTAAALGLPLGQALPFLGWTSVAGVGLLMVLAVFRIVGRSFGPVDAKGRALLPYGVAIACGFWAVLVVN